MDKKRLIIITILITLLITFIVVGYFQGGKLDDESKAYADLVIPAISRRLEPDNLIRFACPEFKSRYSDAELLTMMNDYKGFGDFIRFSGAKGEARYSVGFGMNGTHDVTADYQVIVDFTETEAVVRVTLVKSPLIGWSILDFAVFPV